MYGNGQMKFMVLAVLSLVEVHTAVVVVITQLRIVAATVSVSLAPV
jgi:hypothetical protein